MGKVDIWSTQQRYSVIYADPPWSYVQGGRGAAKKHYATMTAEEIENLPVKRLADANCTLFLWVTFPNLKQGLSTIEAWGFKYKTIAFNWVKKTKRGKYFWGVRTLDAKQFGNMPFSGKRNTEKNQRKRAQCNRFGGAGTQPKARRSTHTYSAAYGGRSAYRAFCERVCDGLGLLGK